MAKKKLQRLADAAYAAMIFGASRDFGLLRGGPDVDLHECLDVLEYALHKNGTVPEPEVVDDLIDELIDRH